MTDRPELLDKASLDQAFYELRTDIRRMGRVIVIRTTVAFAAIVVSVLLAFLWYRGWPA
jgi:hypothetical protein